MKKRAKSVTERVISKRSEELAQFIDLANARLYEPLLSPGELFDSSALAKISPLRTPPASRRQLTMGAKRESSKSELTRLFWAKQCKAIASTMPVSVSKFLGSPDDVWEFMRKYRDFWQARQLIPAIARRDWKIADHPKFARNFDEYKRTRAVQKGLPMAILVSAQIDVAVNAGGEVEILIDPVLKSLEGIAANRIRTCPVCGQIFWAQQSNSPCCSKSHRKTFNTRNSRNGLSGSG
jgi:hypothetical protein